MSDVLLALPEASETTLIVFSHRWAKNFAFYDLTSQLGCNRILVRDPENAWYNNGIEGVGADIAEIAEKLRTIVKDLGTTRLFTLGASMGGYAAIVFGSLLGADSVLAFSPQTTLDSRFPLSPAADLRREIPDVRTVLGDGRTIYNLVTGEEDLVDLYYVSRLLDLPNIRHLVAEGATHIVVGDLHKRGELVPLLNAWMAGDPLPFVSEPKDLLRPEIRRVVDEAIPTFCDRRYKDALPSARLLATRLASHAGSQHLYGICAYYCGEIAEAEDAQRRAISLRPGWGEPERHLGQCLLARGKPAEAEAHLRNAVESNDNWAEAHFWLGECLRALDRHEEAQTQFRTAVKLKPNWQEARLKLDAAAIQV